MNNTKIKNSRDEKWNQWFAGLTDGDGCFYLNKAEKSVSFEITTRTTDTRVLYNVKNELKAGAVRLRSGSESVRYRVKQKAVIIDIVNRLNGKLYNPARVDQFQKVCALLNIEQHPTPPLVEKESAYLAGLIDSDGSLAISVTNSSSEDSQISGVLGKTTRLTNSRGYSQISLKVTSVHEPFLIMIQDSYGCGSIYKEKASKQNRSPKDKYHWTIKSLREFELVYGYLKKYPLKSVKMHRMRLALLYFKYKALGYNLKPSGTIESKIWAKFAKSWFKYSN